MRERTHTVHQALKAKEGEEVSLLGWVAHKATLGAVTFIRLRDGLGYIQLAIKKGICKEDSLKVLKDVSLESSIWVKGKVREDKRAPEGKELLVLEGEVIAKADKWPITKDAIKSVSFLYDNRHLSIRGKKATSVMRIRNELIKAIMNFFYERDFILINTPTLVQSAVEGGATLFELDYFGKKAYLSQSAQLYEEAAICSFGKVFVLQPAFRAEKSKTSKHLTEFWMLEAEQAFTDYLDNMKIQEELIYQITKQVEEKCKKELEILNRNFKAPEPPYYRITYDEARDLALKREINFEWGEDIPTEAERIISLTFDKPIFITHFPLSARSFYHLTDEQDKITYSSDLYAPEGYGEIATGGQRIHDYNKLLERIEKYNLPLESFKWYLDLRRYGMPPHSGFGLGIERTLRWICALKHIRAASLFPRTMQRLNP
ncbi:MAG: asparagine--tRNA ligase [Nitrososphaerales archaeon]